MTPVQKCRCLILRGIFTGSVASPIFVIEALGEGPFAIIGNSYTRADVLRKTAAMHAAGIASATSFSDPIAIGFAATINGAGMTIAEETSTQR